MPANLNFFDTYTMIALIEEVVPKHTFFKDRYAPTEEGDIFASDKVLTEYQKGDRKMAAFVSSRVGDIPVARGGYAVHEYQPAFIAPSRLLTLDDLQKRGFGEALYPGMTKAQRAARLQQKDLGDMDKRIINREEWMVAQTMTNNACTMQTYIDDHTKGEKNDVKFFDGDVSEHTYTVSKKWETADGNIRADVTGMCRMLSRRGLPAVDLLLGTDAAEAVLANKEMRELLEKTSGIIIGEVNQQLTAYDGVVFMGQLNFGGFRLNVFSVDERFEDEDGKEKPVFSATGAMVTAPRCCHTMYGQITQIDYGSTDFSTYANMRVPKLIVDQPNDTRKLRLATRPLVAPHNYCPYIYAADVVGTDP